MANIPGVFESLIIVLFLLLYPTLCLCLITIVIMAGVNYNCNHSEKNSWSQSRLSNVSILLFHLVKRFIESKEFVDEFETTEEILWVLLQSFSIILQSI